MANADLSLLESDSTTTVVKFLDVGRQAAAASKSLALATEDLAALNDITTALGGVATETTLDSVLTAIVGDVAHDAADEGNAAKVGFKAKTALNGITLVADADRTDAYSGVDGLAGQRPHALLGDIVDGTATDTAGSSTAVLAASGSASVYTWLSYLSIFNSSSANVVVAIKSGTTTMMTLMAPANSGVIFNPQVPQPPNAANEAWNFHPGAATTTVYCNALGFKTKIAPV